MRKKLTLKTETLRSLTRAQLGAAEGGMSPLSTIATISAQTISYLQLCPQPTVGCPRDTRF